MPTINSRKMVYELIAAKGYYMDDPRVVKIVEYRNGFNGGLAYGLIYEGMPLDNYDASPFIINPKTLWEVTK